MQTAPQSVQVAPLAAKPVRSGGYDTVSVTFCCFLPLDSEHEALYDVARHAGRHRCRPADLLDLRETQRHA